jgi:hypothetical protein
VALWLGIELDAAHRRTATERLGLAVAPQLDVADEMQCMPWLRPFTRYAEDVQRAS